MITKKILQWRKWWSPFGEDFNDEPGAIPQPHDVACEECGGDCAVIDDDHKVKVGPKESKLIVTPMGIIPLGEFNSPNKNFNIWIADTNFNITKDIIRTVEKIDGIEGVWAFSRYRMIIGFGRVFESEVVKSDIEMALGVIDQLPLVRVNTQLWKDVCVLRQRLSKKPHWAIYVLPNSKVCGLAADENVESVKIFEEQYREIEEAKHGVGGYLYSSRLT